MEKNNTTFKYPGDLDSEIWEWLKEHGTEETKQVIMMTARHFAGFITGPLQQKQPEGLHFIPLNRLIQKIPSKNWNDTVNNYAKKLRDCLIKEGYLKDAKVLQDYISYMNGNNVPMATMDKQEQLDGTFNSYDMAKTFTEGQYYVMKHPEKFGLCKPAEWSEEDDRILKAIIDGLGCIQKAGCKRFGGEEMNDVFLWIKNRFKSLHPQSVQDKFDEAMHVADKFEEGYKAGVYDTKAKSWKPTEEQMTILSDLLEETTGKKHEVLLGLYQQLKQL